MAKITVTGATGALGGLIVEALLNRGVPAQDIRASVRDLTKAAHLQENGIETRRGDYDDPASLYNSFTGSEVVLIISGEKVGERVEQHRRAVQAAKEAGARRIVYTSAVHMGVGEERSQIAKDHRATEAILREAGVPFTILRNSFYAEYMLAPVVQALGQGVFVSSVGDGKLGAAARTDMAEAAAVVLSMSGHETAVYELTYPRAWDYDEAVEIASRVSGKPLAYRPVSDEEFAETLAQAGTPEPVAQMLVGMNASLRQGDLSKTTGDLEGLLGHAVTPLEEIVRRLLDAG